MGVLSTIFGGPRPVGQAFPPAPDHDFWYQDAQYASAAGVSVTADSALRASAVYACVRLKARTIASLPLFVYRRLADEGKERATDLPLYDVLRRRPNDWQTAYDFRQMMHGHLELRGNAYARVVPGPRGAVDQLIPLHPDRVEAFRLTNGRIGYELTQPDGTKERMTQDEVFHLRGFSVDGITGLSPITLAREQIGSQIAAQTYGGALWKNDARPRGALRHPGKLSDPALRNLRNSWGAVHGGPHNAGKPAILEEGMDWVNVGMTNDDAQWIDSMKFNVADIARIFACPPHMIGDVERSTSWGGGIEEQGIGFVVYTLTPDMTLWEQACDECLITDPETYYTKFQVQALLRGDQQRRYSAYAIGRQWGWLSANDVRRLEDMNPIEGGDDYLEPLNMVPAGAEREEPADEPDEERTPPAPQQANVPPREAISLLLTDAANRCAAAEVRGLEKRAAKAADDPERWAAWLAEFYAGHERYVARTLQPIADAWAIQGGALPDVAGIAGAVTSDAVLQLSGDPASTVDGWSSTRAGQLAAIFSGGFFQ